MDPEDFLSDSLHSLYDYQPITLTTTGSDFVFTSHYPASSHGPHKGTPQPFQITLQTPDTDAANWSLHASSIWASSLYLSEHLVNLDLQSYMQFATERDPLRVLELGASAGLPSIVIAKLYPDILVTVTDYPDKKLIQTLTENVSANGVAKRCKALPFAWGTDPTSIDFENKGFDMIIAADTLWNPDLHEIFIHALQSTLKKGPTPRVHLVVGLHTGRYTIEAFLHRILDSGLQLVSIEEKERSGASARDWRSFREFEDERERRRWVIWIQLKWKESEI